jgi:hypothetical protein
MSTEQRICTDVPLEVLQQLMLLAHEIRGEQSCIELCKTELKKLGANAASVIGTAIADWQTNGIEEFVLREAIGRAAKSAGWFKDLNSGYKLANLVVAVLPEVAESSFGAKLRALEEWLYVE